MPLLPLEPVVAIGRVNCPGVAKRISWAGVRSGARLVRHAAILQGMIVQSDERSMRALPSQAFGPLETAILGVLGAHHQPLTVREIHAALHDRALAYTTIMTTMARMTKTGRVSRAPTATRYAAAYY
jgi:penicillinase repressor